VFNLDSDHSGSELVEDEYVLTALFWCAHDLPSSSSVMIKKQRRQILSEKYSYIGIKFLLIYCRIISYQGDSDAEENESKV